MHAMANANALEPLTAIKVAVRGSCIVHNHCSSLLCSVGSLADMKEDLVSGILDSRLGCRHPRHSVCTTTFSRVTSHESLKAIRAKM